MSLSEKLPEAVRAVHARLEGPGAERPPVIVTRADLRQDGQFGETWVIVTAERLRVIEVTGGEPVVRHDLALAALRDPRTDSLVGGAVLQARLDGVVLDLARYTDACGRDFGRLCKYLGDVASHGDYLRRKAKGELKPDKKEVKPPELAKDDEEEKRCPSCGLLLLEDSKVCPRCFKKHKVILRILGYMRPHWRMATLFVILLLAGTGISLVPPYLTRPLVDGALVGTGKLPAERLALLGWLVLVLFATTGAVQALGIWRGRVVAWLGTRLGHDLRSEVYRHLQFQSLRFFDKHKTGALMARVGQDTGALEGALIDGVPFFISNILTLIAIAGILLWLNWRLTLLVFVPGPLVAIISHLAWGRLHRVLHRFWHYRARMTSTLNDSLSGMRVIKAFAQERQEVDRFTGHSRDMADTLLYLEQLWATFFPILTGVTILGQMIIWYVGGRDVVGGRMTAGTLLTFIAYLGMFYGPLQFLSRIADWLVRALASAERVFEVLDQPPDVPEAADAVAVGVLKGRVEFSDVTFGYEAHKPVLKRLTLAVAPGEMIGLVGKSGAGKTSAINILCRFYDVQDGVIRIDGVDIRKIRQNDLRQQIGVVLQDTFLFNDTILANIRYAKPDATPEAIMAAAKAANAHDFIVNKPDGYDTVVGERGSRLSGGERQRVAIARAILHDPRILILNEATSNVDADTEKEIQDAIARLIKGRTVFAIAHRLSTLRNANRLVVLKDGEIAEVGTHDELLAKQGEFHRLVELQKKTSAIKAVGGDKGEGP